MAAGQISFLADLQQPQPQMQHATIPGLDKPINGDEKALITWMNTTFDISIQSDYFYGVYARKTPRSNWYKLHETDLWPAIIWQLNRHADYIAPLIGYQTGQIGILIRQKGTMLNNQAVHVKIKSTSQEYNNWDDLPGHMDTTDVLATPTDEYPMDHQGVMHIVLDRANGILSWVDQIDNHPHEAPPSPEQAPEPMRDKLSKEEIKAKILQGRIDKALAREYRFSSPYGVMKLGDYLAAKEVVAKQTYVQTHATKKRQGAYKEFVKPKMHYCAVFADESLIDIPKIVFDSLDVPDTSRNK